MDKTLYTVLNTIATTNAKAKIAALLLAQAKMGK